MFEILNGRSIFLFTKITFLEAKKNCVEHLTLICFVTFRVPYLYFCGVYYEYEKNVTLNKYWKKIATGSRCYFVRKSHEFFCRFYGSTQM